MTRSKNEKVALDRLRVRQNVFLVLKQLHCCPNTTTLLPSAKCTRPLFQGRTGCGGRPSGWHDIVTCQRLVLILNFTVFERKLTQLPPLAVRVSGDLQAVDFKKSDVIISSIPTTPPWLLTRPAINFTLHCSDKSNTLPEIFKHRFYELCHEFKN